MKIDKTLFLMLTGTLAGCAVHLTTGPDTPANPQAATPPPAPAAPATPPSGGKLAFKAKHRAALKRPVAPGDPTPPTDPSVAPAVTPPVTPAPTAEGGACVDPATAAPAATCKTFAAGDANCAKAQQMCTAFGTYFKPYAASAGINSISSSTSDCATAAAEGHRAANSANLCADTRITQLCTTLAVQCKVTPDACAKELAQLNEAGLQKVGACAASNACGSGLHGCVNTLFPTFEWGPY